MHDGPTHARDRSAIPGASGGRRPAPTPDPIDELTELFLGEMPGKVSPLLDDDLPLPPLKSDPAARPRPDPTDPTRTTARPAVPPPATPPPNPGPTPSPGPAPVLTHTPGPAHEPPLTPARGDGGRPAVEVVVVGHLPVAAAAWVHQYARHRQRQLHGTVALARWRGPSMTVDLVGEGTPADLPRCASPAEALAAAGRFAGVLLVSVEETDELEAAVLPGVDRVTVLTGSHDTAVVSCYRALKGLAPAEPVREGRTQLMVAVLGGPEERSKAAAARLSRTAAAYLSHAVPCEVASDRIGPSRAVTLFAGPAGESPLALLRAFSAVPAAEDPAVVGAVVGAAGVVGEVGVVGGAMGMAAGRAVGEGVSLLSQIPGVRRLATRCPHAPSVELGVGEDGSVHALASAPRGADVARAVADLTVASAWVQTNAAVLASAVPELARRVGAAPREHLVTGEPRAARGLLDSRVKVHARAADGSLLELN